MKTILSTAVAVLAALALAGCGGAADQADQSPSSGATPPSSAAPIEGAPNSQPPQTGPAPTKPPAPQVTINPDGKVTVPAGYRELPAKQVDAKALPESYKERRVWSSEDGKALQLVGIASDACAGVDAQVVEFTEAVVKVSLTPMTSPQGGTEGKMCAMVVTPRPVEVPLEQPVGDRTVVVVAGG
ncbi:hypothetical protein [Actinokineospora globicatena]|uniref:Uncharacterized protein n=1 Tax=Actinokineospora globicatena TaxID=103729 RepID=A0A9W6V9X5_9PSEU|nr:hypothetical protein [Actinokineospora globicatena]MCP2302621.1 hypothetical protein [Actinokineospora globicatena]GLW75691.1 hypothetical protein Aglo01_01730 [Actinokineospora globicatena]GLW82532.1 hypothetical protein Aglo02_01730 [Actinokineospora globicatena]GLW91476.1 hypothetical protein Aglo03_22920 [Actinokineospora globicatena]